MPLAVYATVVCCGSALLSKRVLRILFRTSRRQAEFENCRFSIACSSRFRKLFEPNRQSKIGNRCSFWRPNMKKHSVVLVMIAMLAALGIPAAFAQATGTVKGVAKDMQGNPIAGATVEWYNTDNGRKYNLKTNKKGEYFSLGIEPGKYKVTLTQDGKQLDQVSNFPVGLEETVLDFDLKKAQAEAAQQKGISAEQLKQMQEAQAKNAKEAGTVKALNEKLSAANQSMQTGDFEAALTTLNEATQIDPTRDLLWARLGDANLGAAPKQT